MAWASQSNGAATRLAAASPAVSQTDEMMGTSHTPTGNHSSKVESIGVGSDLLADVPEEIDQRHRRAADHRGTTGHEDADLAPARQMRVGGVGAETPHNRRDDQREDGQDEDRKSVV